MTVLTEEQLETFRARLEDAKAAAQSLLAQSAQGEERVEVSGSSIGRLTRIDAIQMQGMSQMSRAQLDVRLQQIEAALECFAHGTYGTCRSCKSSIHLARLEALPEAPLCVECQEELEHS